MTPSIKFDRWAEKNKDRIESEGKDLKDLVKFTSLYLKSIYAARKGVSHVIAAGMFETPDKLNAELAARGIKGPDLTLPKIKIVQPARRASIPKNGEAG